MTATTKKKHVRRQDAMRVAEELLAEVRRHAWALALFLLPAGDFRITPPFGRGFNSLVDNRAILVGVYDGGASKHDLVEDIWVMCAEAGIAWAR